MKKSSHGDDDDEDEDEDDEEKSESYDMSTTSMPSRW